MDADILKYIINLGVRTDIINNVGYYCIDQNNNTKNVN